MVLIIESTMYYAPKSVFQARSLSQISDRTETESTTLLQCICGENNWHNYDEVEQHLYE